MRDRADVKVTTSLPLADVANRLRTAVAQGSSGARVDRLYGSRLGGLVTEDLVVLFRTSGTSRSLAEFHGHLSRKEAGTTLQGYVIDPAGRYGKYWASVAAGAGIVGTMTITLRHTAPAAAQWPLTLVFAAAAVAFGLWWRRRNVEAEVDLLMNEIKKLVMSPDV